MDLAKSEAKQDSDEGKGYDSGPVPVASEAEAPQESQEAPPKSDSVPPASPFKTKAEANETKSAGEKSALPEFTALRPPTAEQAIQLAEGLTLGDETVPLPRFHEIGWIDNQAFTEEDDPDRIKEPWKPPSFIRLKDPVEQRAKTTVEELELPESKRGKTFARVVRGVMDPAHCAELINCINAKGFTPVLLSTGKGTQQLSMTARNGFRAMVDCPELADWLFQVIKPHLPEEVSGEVNNMRLVGLNERCRFLFYTPGQYFKAHLDANVQVGRKLSRVTVQVYLHDVPVENGGATTFRFPGGVLLPCQPGAGSVLIFKQDLLHEGSEVHAGFKYTFRTEAFYEE